MNAVGVERSISAEREAKLRYDLIRVGPERTGMNLPSRMSKLLTLQAAADSELNVRFREIFMRHRGVAFAGRQDNLFAEHWTPESAAANYQFSGYEIKNDRVTLHGLEQNAGFVYRIAISLPVELVDKPSAIDCYFQKQAKEARETFNASDPTREDPETAAIQT